MSLAFQGKDAERPRSGEVLSVGAGTVAVQVGATVFRNVAVAPPLDVNDILAGDQVALTWHGEQPFATAVLNPEAGGRSVSTETTTTTTSGGSSGGVSDHGELTGLSDDDHPQYTGHHDVEVITGTWLFENYLDAAEMSAPANPDSGRRRVFVDSATGKLSVRTSGGSTVSLEEGAGVSDHGSLTGLTDDDHTQYLNTTRHDTTDRHTLGSVVPHDNLADLAEKNHASLDSVGADDHHAGFIGLEDNDATAVTPAADDRIQLQTANNKLSIGAGTNVITFTVNEGNIVHGNLSGYVSAEHVNHTSVTLTAGAGLSGGGDISASRSFAVAPAQLIRGGDAEVDGDKLDIDWNPSNYTPATTPSEADHADNLTAHLYGIDQVLGSLGTGMMTGLEDTDTDPVSPAGDGRIQLTSASNKLSIEAGTNLLTFTVNEGNIVHGNLSGYASSEHVNHTSVTLTAGAGLTGGGDISASRSFAVGAGSGVTVNADDVAVDPAQLIRGGAAEIDGDKLDIDWNPSNYSPSTTPTEVTSADHLTAHLYGIDQALAGAISDHGALSGLGDDDHSQYLTTGRHDTTTRHTLGSVVPHDNLADLSEKNHSSLDGVSADQHHAGFVGLEDNSGTGVTPAADDRIQLKTGNTKLSVTAGTNIVTFTVNEGNIVHDNLSGFVSNEHINHTSVTLTAGNGLTGGGDISASRSFAVGAGDGINVGATAVSVNTSAIVDTSYGLEENNNNIRINLAGTSGLEFSSGALQIDDAIAGDGLSITNKVLSVDEGAVDHGSLSGLGDDDHTQYLNTTRHDTTTRHTLGSVVPHDNLADLAEKDHDSLDSVGADDHHTAFIGLEDHSASAVTPAADDRIRLATGNSILGIAAGTNILTFTVDETEIDHDNLTNFVSNEHINHTAVSITAGSGLAGGGTIAASRTLNVGAGDGIDVAADSVSVDVTDLLGSGLTESSNNIDLDWGTPTIGTIEPDDSASAGSSTNPARSDHQHAIVTAAPSTVQVQSNAEGSASSFARSDHLHNVSTGTPGADSVNVSASSAGTATSLARSDHTHNLDESIAPTWAGTHTFNADIQLNADLDFIGGQQITTTDGGNLTLKPAGDIVLDPDGYDVLPGAGYEINVGSQAKKYLTVHAAELAVETLVAEDTRATISGRIIVGPTTQFTADFLSTEEGGTEKIGNAGFETSGSGGFANWSEVTGDGAIARDDTVFHGGAYSCKLTSGPGSNTFVYQNGSVTAGNQVILRFWTRGDGVDAGRYRVYDVTNAADIVAITSTGVTSETWDEVVLDFTVPVDCVSIRVYCYCPGTDDGVAYFDDVSLRVAPEITVKHNDMADGDIAYAEADGNVEFFEILGGPGGSEGAYTYPVLRNLDGSGANDWYAGAALTNTGTAGEGFIDIYSNQGIGADSGPAIAGLVRQSSTYNDWVESWALGNLDGLYGYGATTYGVGLGAYSLGNYLTVDNTYGIRFYDENDTNLAQLSGAEWRIGDELNEHVVIDTEGLSIWDAAIRYALFAKQTVLGETGTGHIVLGTGGVDVYIDGTTRVASYSTSITLFDSAGADRLVLDTTGITVGDTDEGEYLKVSSSGIDFYGGGSQHGDIGNDGSFWFGAGVSTERLSWDSTNGLRLFDHDNNAVITFETDGDAVLTGELQLSGTGSALAIGETPPTAADAGTGLWLDRTGLYSLASGTYQVKIDATDGALYAGAGAVTLDTDGISIDSGEDDANKVKWFDDTTLVAAIHSYVTAGAPYWNLSVDALDDAHVSAIQLEADQPNIVSNPPNATLFMRSGTTAADAYIALATGSYMRIGINEDIVEVRNTDLYTFDGDGFDGDVRIDGGLYVGANDTDPADGAAWIAGDARVGGGLIVGTATDDAADGTIEIFKPSGDPIIAFNINESAIWLVGIDDTDDTFKINYGSTLPNDGDFELNSAGEMSLYQAGSDANIVELKSSDVSHGVTDYASDNAFGAFVKTVADEGGLRIYGLSENTWAVGLHGIATNDVTTKSAAASACSYIVAQKKSGSGGGAMGSNANLLAIVNNTTTTAIFDAEGELHLDATVSESAWDKHDDMALLHGLRAATVPALKERWGQFITEARPVLEASGVATFNEDGSVWIGMRGLQMLVIDALRQFAGDVETRLSQLEKLLPLLEEEQC